MTMTMVVVVSVISCVALFLLIEIVTTLKALQSNIILMNNNKQQNSKEYDLNEAVNVGTHFVYLSLFKMYHDGDLMDFDSMVEALQKNVHALRNNQELYNEWLTKLKEVSDNDES